jgi:hypothetical protein
MRLYENEFSVPKPNDKKSLIPYFQRAVLNQLSEDETPIRFVVTRSDDKSYKCEIGVLSEPGAYSGISKDLIFGYSQRPFERTGEFNAALIVPTGIDAEIGGDAGDAAPVARLMASACDNLVTHPNVVNASDLNEMPENGLYVEGSVLTRLLMGTIGLQKVRSNRLLVVLDKHDDQFMHEAAINSVSAARASMGIDCPTVLLLDEKFSMAGLYSKSGRAVGSITHLERLCELLDKHKGSFDAVALSSIITVPPECHADYFIRDDMVNPWGGVEAMLTHAISSLFDIPSAHSPMLEDRSILNLDVGIVDPRKAAEAVSTTFLHCILKGLHKSPRIVNNPPLDSQSGLLTVSDMSCIVIPDGCVGLPTLAAIEQGIPVIAVRENTNRMQNRLEDYPFASGQLHVVDNYLEAVGVMHAIRAGVSKESVRRPMKNTNVVQTGHDAVAEEPSVDLKSDTKTGRSTA